MNSYKNHYKRTLLIRILGLIIWIVPLLAEAQDLNGDGSVNSLDIGVMMKAWGTADPFADLNADGVVNQNDLELLLAAFINVATPGTAVLDAVPASTTDNPLSISGSGTPGLRIRLYVNNQIQATTIVGADGRYQLTALLQNGANTIHVTEQAGSAEGPPSNTLNVTFALPEPILDPIPSPTAAAETIVSGSALPGYSVHIYVNDLLSNTITADGRGYFVSRVGIKAGDNTIYAVVSDGRIDSAASNTLVVNQSAPPSGPVSTYTVPELNHVISPVNTATYMVSGNANPNDAITIYRNGALQTSITANSEGVFSATVNLLEGINTITATLSNTAQGTSNYSEARIIVRDSGLVLQQIGGALSGSLVSGAIYEVTSTISVSNGATLTIPANVSLRFNQGTQLIVSAGGVLNVNGTATDPVVFTSVHDIPNVGDWMGIEIRGKYTGTTNTTEINATYMVVEYSDKGLEFIGATALPGYFTGGVLTNSTIRYNNYGVYLNGGPSSFPENDPYPVINSSNFYQNIQYNYYTTNYHSENRITNNKALDARNNWWGSTDLSVIGGTIFDEKDGNGAGVAFGPYLQSESGSVANYESLFGKVSGILNANTVYLVTADVEVSPSKTLTIPAGTRIEVVNNAQIVVTGGILNVNGTATDPVVFTSGYDIPQVGDWMGIQIRGEYTGTTNITEINAAYMVVEYAEKGLEFIGYSTSPGYFTGGVITNSTIRYNNYGVYLNGGPSPYPENDPYPVINNSNFYQNAQYNYYATNYHSENRITNNKALDARNNWWGSANFGVIGGTIYDEKDGNGAGVAFGPYLLSENGSAANYESLYGQVSGTLRAGAVYLVTADVELLPSKTLTIPAGTRIEVGNNAQIMVRGGTLNVNGTAADPVVFTSAYDMSQVGDWRGIRMEGQPPATTINATYMVVEYAGKGLEFIGYNASPGYSTGGVITNSTIRNNNYGVYLNGGPSAYPENDPYPVINSSNFYQNAQYNYYTANYHSENRITNYKALDARNNWWGSTDLGVIGGTIYDEKDGNGAGVAFGPYLLSENGSVANYESLFGKVSGILNASTVYLVTADVEVPPSKTLTIPAGTRIEVANNAQIVVTGGTLNVNGTAADPVVFTSAYDMPQVGDWGGIRMEGQPPATTINATYMVVEYAGKGLEFIGYNASPGYSTGGVITNSTIRNNNYGVYLNGGPSAYPENDPYPVINSSNFYHNIQYNYYTTNYHSENRITNNKALDARNNWWGSTDPSVIGGTIFDEKDGNGAGVAFGPYLLSENGSVANYQSLFGQVSGTLKVGTVYLVTADVQVAPGQTLTVPAGTRIEVGNGAQIVVYAGATLNINGTAGEPVVFTSANDMPKAGDWVGIVLHGGTSAISITDAIIRYADKGIYFSNDAGGTVQNSVIQYNNYGIYVQGPSSSPLLTNNTIVFNNYGLYLEYYKGAPQPTITNNDLYGNTNVELYLSKYGLSSTVVLNVSNNWWGTPSPVIGTQIVFDNTAQSVTPISNPASQANNSPPPVIQLDQINISNVSFGTGDPSTLEPLLGQTLPVNFTTNFPATVSLRIYPELGGALVREITQTYTTAGAKTLSWDGRDNNGNIVPEDAYIFQIYATNGQTSMLYQVTGTRTEGSNTGVVPATFNPNHNDFMKIQNYSLASTSRVTMTITPSGGSAFTPINRKVFEAGTPLMMWDGRDPSGKIVDGSVQVNFSVPETLLPNSIIVKGTTPKITGSDAPNIEVKANPYKVYYSYEQDSQIAYRITQDSYVTVKLLPPGIYDPNYASAITLVNNELQPANDTGGPIDYTVTWEGVNVADSNRVIFDDFGVYTFTIEATGVQSGLSTLYRGSVTLKR